VKIHVLNDNRPKYPCLSEHGLSWLLEVEGERILFDTGASDLFLRNARAMGLTLDDVDTVVLSHGHYDHGNGLVHLFRDPPRRLVCHPEAFAGKYRRGTGHWLGLPLTRQEAGTHFRLVTTREPLQLSDRILFLGEIPRRTDFESKHTAFVDAEGRDDFMPDDSGVAVLTTGGLVVITGCGHAGICNTVLHAREVTGEKRVLAVMGGFHLKEDDETTRRTVDCLYDLGVRQAWPSHCTELPALARFYERFRNRFVRSGHVITLG